MSKEKNQWSSNMSFILAMIGSAVGLGNIWRYPMSYTQMEEGHFTSPTLQQYWYWQCLS